MQEEGSKKNAIDLTRYARALIVIAIILLACGFFIDALNTNRTLDPIKAIKSDTRKGDSVTTIDIVHWSDDINEVDFEGNPVKPQTTPGSSGSGGTVSSSGATILSGGSHSSSGSGIAIIGGGSGSGSSGESGSGTETGTGSGSGSESGSGNDTSTPPANIDNVNNQLRNSIQSTYDITVKYGSETNGYTVGGMTTNSIADPYVVNQNLNKLNTALGLYPNGLGGVFEAVS